MTKEFRDHPHQLSICCGLETVQKHRSPQNCKTMCWGWPLPSINISKKLVAWCIIPTLVLTYICAHIHSYGVTYIPTYTHAHIYVSCHYCVRGLAWIGSFGELGVQIYSCIVLVKKDYDSLNNYFFQNFLVDFYFFSSFFVVPACFYVFEFKLSTSYSAFLKYLTSCEEDVKNGIS